MPYVNIKITREGATPVQKARLINGVTDLIENVLKADPSMTRIDISEVEMDDWRLGGLPVDEFRYRIGSPVAAAPVLSPRIKRAE